MRPATGRCSCGAGRIYPWPVCGQVKIARLTTIGVSYSLTLALGRLLISLTSDGADPRGSQSSTQVPFPCSLVMRTVPPDCRAKPSTIDRFRPVPFKPLVHGRLGSAGHRGHTFFARSLSLPRQTKEPQLLVTLSEKNRNRPARIPIIPPAGKCFSRRGAV